MNYWIITVKEPYCGYILRGMKTMEIRRSVPSTFIPGDVVFIVRKGEKGHIVGACRVTSVLKESPNYFAHYRRRELRLCEEVIKEYAGDRRSLYGIGLKRIYLNSWCLTVRSLGFERAPQHFYKIKPAYISTIDRVLVLMEPEIDEKVTIDGITYDCKETENRGWKHVVECDLHFRRAMGCIDCEVQCNAHYRKDGKHIVLKEHERKYSYIH